MKKLWVVLGVILGLSQMSYAQGVLRGFASHTLVVATPTVVDAASIRNSLVHDIASVTGTVKPGLTVAAAFKQFDAVHALKDTVDNAQDNRQAVVYELQMVELATIMNRNDILCWQLNNVGWYIIQEFKGRTGYDERVAQLATLNKKDKQVALLELKTDVQNNLPFLRIAKPYLQRAWELNEKITTFDVDVVTPDTVLKDAISRTKAIENNLRFIDWVENFGLK